MRFIFSLVAHQTYALLCLSIQFVILFFYRMLFFRSIYLLSMSLVVLLIVTTVIFYALCILLLVIFDLDHFRSRNDIAVEKYVYKQTDQTEEGLEQKHVTEASGTNKTPAEQTNATVVFHEKHMNALCVLTLCHLTIFVAIFSVLAVCLCECVYTTDSLLCANNIVDVDGKQILADNKMYSTGLVRMYEDGAYHVRSVPSWSPAKSCKRRASNIFRPTPAVALNAIVPSAISVFSSVGVIIHVASRASW